MKRPAQILTEARAIVANPETWAIGTAARSANGRSVDVFDPSACKFCSYGAVFKVAGERLYSIYDARHPAVDQLEDKHTITVTMQILLRAMDNNIGRANDRLSHEEVLAKWDKAIQAARNWEEWYYAGNY